MCGGASVRSARAAAAERLQATRLQRLLAVAARERGRGRIAGSSSVDRAACGGEALVRRATR